VGRVDALTSLSRRRRPEVALVDVGSEQVDVAGLRSCAALTTVVVVYDRLSGTDLSDLCRVGVDMLLPCSHGLDALLVVLRRYLADDRADALRPDCFTELERQIITLVGAGHTVHQIAQLLEVSTSSVANTKRRIYRKLEVYSQGQAIARATALGIVTRPQSQLPPASCLANSLPAVLRGTAGPAWQQTQAALLAGGIPVMQHSDQEASLVVLVDPAPDDWPTGREAGLPVVLVRSEPPRRAEVLTALLRGACAVMNAERVATDLVAACTLAAHGHVTVEADAARAVLDAVRAPSGLPELTSRELDILRLIASGHTVRQTARALGIAAKTVENTQSRLYRKLGARNRSGALVAAHALGLLELRPEPALDPSDGFAPRS
jgi:two-component system, NarL family, nitrate/nitrite response regulator NarL